MGYFLNLTENFARNFMLSASDWSTKFLRCKCIEFMPNEICVFNRQNVRNDLFLKPSMKTKYLRLSEHNF